jgi:hypothetical protein
MVKEKYGDLGNFYTESSGPADLERRLQEFKGLALRRKHIPKGTARDLGESKTQAVANSSYNGTKNRSKPRRCGMLRIPTCSIKS